MTKYHPLKELFVARMKTFYREPEAIFWSFIFPVLLTIGLGIAFRNKQADVIHVGIVDTAGAQDIKAQLDRSDRFKVQINDAHVCADRLRLGKDAVVVVPGEKLEYRFDPTRPESNLARALLDDALQRAAGRSDVRLVSDVEITEPGARYIDFLIPGLLGMNLMGGGLWGVGFVITEMRVKNLLRRFVATPMRRSDFLIAIAGGRMAFLFPEFTLLIGAGVILFDVRITGSILNAFIIAVIGALSFSAMGLLIASRAKKIETAMGLMNFAMLPMWIISGVFFSSERFPDFLQPFIKALPLTQAVDALRSVVLDGAGLADQALPILILTAWGAGSFIIALKIFRWT